MTCIEKKSERSSRYIFIFFFILFSMKKETSTSVFLRENPDPSNAG